MAENSGDLSLGYMMGQSENRGGGGGFGGDFGQGLWAVIILAILFGRGGFGGGFGGFGGGGGSESGGGGVAAGFAWQGIDNGIRAIQQGLCDGFYAVNTGMLNGFHGVDNAICTLGYQTQQGFNTLGYAMKDCCCETQRLVERGFCDLGGVISTSTRDIVENNNANYRDLKDFLVTEKLAAKDAKIAELNDRVGRAELGALVGAQIDAAVATILRRTGAECPTAAYLVNAPTPVSFPVNSCGQVQFGNFGGYGNYGNNCGCGGGCGCG